MAGTLPASEEGSGGSRVDLCGSGGLIEDLEVFARFEADGLSGGDADFRAGARVASDACLPGLDGEDAEATEFDTVSFDEALLHGFEDGVDGGFCLGADQSCSFDDSLNEILFDQVGPRCSDGAFRIESRCAGEFPGKSHLAQGARRNSMLERGLAIVNSRYENSGSLDSAGELSDQAEREQGRRSFRTTLVTNDRASRTTVITNDGHHERRSLRTTGDGVPVEEEAEMSIKSDRWIREQATERAMITPFSEKQVREGVISYGLSSYGYDLRVSDEFKIFTNVNSAIIDPKAFDERSFVTVQAPSVIVPPNSFALARSIEYFKIPRDVLTICVGKSTYARCGIIVNVTPFEPEWEGFVTLEISNTTPLPARVYANEGLCQILFFQSDEVCEVSYADRKGKYQNQQGIVLPKL
jgi:dCTP deaminase